MKRKTAVLVIAYLCAAVAFTGVYAALQRIEARKSERNCSYAAEHAFEELVAAVDALEPALEKSALAASPGLCSALCTDACASAEAGLAALALMRDSFELEKLAAFLATAGDYTRTLSRAAAAGAEWTDAERGSLRELASVASDTLAALDRHRGEIAEGNCCCDDTPEALRELDRELPSLSLHYDGRYADTQRESAMLAGKELTGEKEACVIAAAFLGADARGAECLSQSGGEGHEWRVRLGDTTVLVSGRGGQVLSAVCERIVGEPFYSPDDARAEAEKYLRDHGYAAMREVAHENLGGCYVSEWCAVQQGVVCYVDRVRLSIALDDGSLAAFEAGEYVKNHRERRFDLRSTVSEESAAALLAPGLTVEEHYFSLIATAGGEERLCHTFRCRDEGGAQALIFSSAATGSQERIALLREDEYGSYSV